VAFTRNSVCDGNWIYLAQAKVWWSSVVNVATELRMKEKEKLVTGWETISFSATS
jgi:hypothetical protein